MRLRYLLIAPLALSLALLLPGNAQAGTPRPMSHTSVATSYVVVNGDWLVKIATRQCGNGARWDDIYNLNRAVIGANPNLIRAGQRLLMPSGCTASGAAAPAPRTAAPSGGAWVHPLWSGAATSSCYGWRPAIYRNGVLISKAGLHAGVDMDAARGTAIRAAHAGVVVRAGWRGGYGYAVEISHGNGITSLYAHQSRIVVWSGRVVAGQVIGRVGTTGASTGNHLHYELRRNGVPFSPGAFMRGNGVRFGC